MAGYFKLSAAKYRYSLNSSETAKQLATSSVELVGVLITGGGSSIAVRIIDSKAGVNEAGPGPRNLLIGANSGESFQYDIPTVMTEGLYAEIEQGSPFNGEAVIFYR